MPIVEYTCPKCLTTHEEIVSRPFVDKKPCSTEGCDGEMARGLGYASTYKITGDNSSSVSPRKHQGRF